MPNQITEVGYGNDMKSYDYDAQGEPEAYGGSSWDNSAPVGSSDFTDPITIIEATTRAPVDLNGMESGIGMAGPLGDHDLTVMPDNMRRANERLSSSFGSPGQSVEESPRNRSMSLNGSPDAMMDKWTEPCALTTTEFEAHKAQMAADADDARKSKLIHLAIAAGAGFFLARFMR
jgi:hypothetical protein